MNRRPSNGFTLIEMMTVTVILGFISVVIVQSMSQRDGEVQRWYNEHHKLNNEKAKSALLNFARAQNFANRGVVPDPYTGGGYASTLLNPTNTTLAAAFTDAGLTPKEINDDGLAVPKIRAYQLVSNLTAAVAMNGPGTEQVTLRYQFGAVYQTACRVGDATCAPTPATGAPGTSSALTALNFTSWKSSGTDGDAATFSTLPLQRDMLAETVSRLQTIQLKAQAYFNQMMIKTTAGDETNHYPSGATSLAGQDPLSATGQGCRDGWYPLNTGNILPTFNLSVQEYGTTKWGGVIEYCRDYDPTGSKGPGDTPHYAAIRINRDVSRGIAPDPAVIGNNVILTM